MARITEKELREYASKFGNTESGQQVLKQLNPLPVNNPSPGKPTKTIKTDNAVKGECYALAVAMAWVVIIASLFLPSKILAIIALVWNIILTQKIITLNRKR